MRVRRLLLTGLGLISVVLMAACVPILNPLYTEADLVLDNGLLGSWVEEEGDRWKFERSVGNSYTLTYQEMGMDSDPPEEPGKPAKFEAHLVRLGDDLFMDLYPDSHPDGFDIENELLAWHLVPAHSISRIWIDKDAIRIGLLDPDWLDKALSSGEIEIAHKRGEEGVLITATTPELEVFARSQADNVEAFGVMVDLQRVEG